MLHSAERPNMRKVVRRKNPPGGMKLQEMLDAPATFQRRQYCIGRDARRADGLIGNFTRRIIAKKNWNRAIFAKKCCLLVLSERRMADLRAQLWRTHAPFAYPPRQVNRQLTESVACRLGVAFSGTPGAPVPGGFIPRPPALPLRFRNPIRARRCRARSPPRTRTDSAPDDSNGCTTRHD